MEENGTEQRRSSSKYQYTPTLCDIKKLWEEINDLVCEIDEQAIFEALVNEAVEMENKIHQVVEAWRTDADSIDETKRLIDYIVRVPIEFPYKLTESLRTIYKQAQWLRKLHEYESLTIADIQHLIDEFKRSTVSTSTSSIEVTSNRVVKKEFDDLLNLFSSATEYNEKANELVKLTSSKKKLEEFERFLDEAGKIPVNMENVDEVERIVKEAKKWSQQVSKLLVNDEQHLPYLCDLVELFERGKKSPVAFSVLDDIEARIRTVNQWIASCHDHFVLPEVNHYHQHHHNQDSEANANMNLPLIEVSICLLF